MESQSLNVSIIVPTYRHKEELVSCIKSLETQTYPKEKIDIIIVNNDPSDTEIEYLAMPSNVKIVTEEQPGSYAARNKGLSVATGDIVAFTDSDCLPCDGWIKNAVDCFNQNSEIHRLAGPVEIFRLHDGNWLAWQFDKISAFHQRNCVKLGHAVTANLFVTRELLDNVGGFDTRIYSGGDIEFGKKASELGFPIFFCESAVVRHPARRTMKDIFKKKMRVAGGSVQRAKLRRRHYKYLLQLLIPPIKSAKVWLREGRGVIGVILAFPIAWLIKIIMFYESVCVLMGREPKR